jgi:hypothetical protein
MMLLLDVPRVKRAGGKPERRHLVEDRLGSVTW